MENKLLITLLFSLFGYLSGSILYAQIAMNLIHHKSLIEVSKNHNPGVSNAYIYGGFWCGTLAVIGDLLKAIVPVHLYIQLVEPTTYGLVLVLIAPVIGHAYSCFWKFKGGMSITASFGVLIGLFPNRIPFILLAVIYIITLLIPHISNSMRSIIAYTLLSISTSFLVIRNVLSGNILIAIILISIIICRKMWLDLTIEDKEKIKQLIKIHS